MRRYPSRASPFAFKLPQNKPKERGGPPERQKTNVQAFVRNIAGKEETSILRSRSLIFSLCFYVQFGSKKKLGENCGPHPTFVFPDELQNVIRARFSLGVKAHSAPKGDQVRLAVYFVSLPASIVIYHMQVYRVTIKDLSQAHWPAAPK